MASRPRRWWSAAGVGVVTLLAVIGSYVEANPVHTYGGLHLTSHPPLAAYLLVGVPALALVGRGRRPVGVSSWPWPATPDGLRSARSTGPRSSRY
jgi:hypothetical protein